MQIDDPHPRVITFSQLHLQEESSEGTSADKRTSLDVASSAGELGRGRRLDGVAVEALAKLFCKRGREAESLPSAARVVHGASARWVHAGAGGVHRRAALGAGVAGRGGAGRHSRVRDGWHGVVGLGWVGHVRAAGHRRAAGGAGVAVGRAGAHFRLDRAAGVVRRHGAGRVAVRGGGHRADGGRDRDGDGLDDGAGGRAARDVGGARGDGDHGGGVDGAGGHLNGRGDHGGVRVGGGAHHRRVGVSLARAAGNLVDVRTPAGSNYWLWIFTLGPQEVTVTTSVCQTVLSGLGRAMAPAKRAAATKDFILAELVILKK